MEDVVERANGSRMLPTATVEIWAWPSRYVPSPLSPKRTAHKQLIDDTFDFLPAAEDLGKPSNGADLRLGLATAPALFAWERNPELGPLIRRKFNGPGDVELARDLVMKSDGIERTQQLARQFASEARALVERLPESPARDALVELTIKVVDRRK